MEATDYKEKLKKIEADFETAKRALHIEYALSNTKYKVGDVIKDSVKVILIDKITTNISLSSLPEPVYHGFELKKDLTPKKNGDRNSIFGHHLVELIKTL